ncbi:uncharacterized protein [Montipora foliosa]|uniref:uncharacterized protein n=1 Tax=Montipora foliosa TaxID=591990 RepID=UPI0035F1160E
MAALVVHDTLSLTTDNGVSKIQLCIGDITKLAKEDEVDVLVVSAFPGDYSPTPSSLIGALSINLGISVRNLSKDKEEDLRRQYFCWWSKPLPEHHSFRRILCFEGGFGSRGNSPPKVVGAVFRCLIPILSGKGNRNGAVIMPLLASGDQGYSKSLMLRLILDSAIHWIKAGLLLKNLKIVLHSRNPHQYDTSFEGLFNCFQEFKDKYDDKKLEYETEVIYDVYVSNSPKDHECALSIVTFLQAQKSVSVFHDFQELNENESWQEEIFNIMGKCSRVIALLSPSYLETESCIEQYNMALCINRRSNGTFLAPFYITSVDSMPTYMSLIQYEDCRPKDAWKIRTASDNVAESLVKPSQKDVASSAAMQVNSRYDVFISYSHQNKTHADKLLAILRSVDPDLKIFIDSAGLNTGTSWQQLLYTALDSSKSAFALLSPEYIQSKVCCEEFCLAYALFIDKDRCLDLVSLMVEPVNELPFWCEGPLPVDCTSPGVDTDQLLSKVCVDLVNRLKSTSPTADDVLTECVYGLRKDSLPLESAMENYRKSRFVLRSNILKTSVDLSCYSRDKKSLRVGRTDGLDMSVDGHLAKNPPESVRADLKQSTSKEIPSDDSFVCDLALSFASSDTTFAVILKQLLLEKIPSLKISEPVSGDFSRVQSLDNAHLVVPLLSSAFLASKELVEELNIAIHRNRNSSRQILFPIQISAIPPKPTYVHLIPCEFSSVDYDWANKVVDENLQDEVFQICETYSMDAGGVFCLKTAANVIVEQLLRDRDLELYPVNRVLLNVRETEENWKRIQKVLYEQQGLEAWKRAFAIEIKKQKGDLKSPEITLQDEEKFFVGVEGSEPRTERRKRFEDDGPTGDKEGELNAAKTDNKDEKIDGESDD